MKETARQPYAKSGRPDRSIGAYEYGAPRSDSEGRRGDGDRMDTDYTQYEIDERFLDDWVAFGMTELNDYLSKHARFDAYYESRESNSNR